MVLSGKTFWVAMQPRPRQYEAFISFKHSGRGGGLTPDAEAAREVYEALVAAGVRTFFSPESLKRHGDGRYAKTIEAALESAKFLVLVASCREHIESRWVETEWDAFINEVRSGNKPDGDLVILNCGNLTPEILPLFLRCHSMYRRGELGDLVQVVKNACAKAPTLGDVIHASLHSFDRKLNRDRIYIVTAHAPGGTEYVIKTHWGPRDAKRLSSMVKKTGVSGEADIKKIVQAIVSEKKRGTEHYEAKPWRSLLTADAMRAMAAELAVEVPKRSRPGAKLLGRSGGTRGGQSVAREARKGKAAGRVVRGARRRST